MNFPIRVHTHYSILRSTILTEKLIPTIKEKGYEYCCITDFASVAGSVEFYKECKKNDIKPILGAEIVVNKEYPATVTLLCTSKDDWSKLVEIISECNSEGNFDDVPRIDEDRLLDLADGHFICIDGYIDSSLFYKMVLDKETALTITDQEVLETSIIDPDWQLVAQEHINKYSPKFKKYCFEVFLNDSESYPISSLIGQKVKSIGEKNSLFVYNANPVYYNDKLNALDHRVVLAIKLKTTLRKLSEKADSWSTKFLNSTNYSLQDKNDNNDLSSLVDLIEEYDILSKPILPKFADNEFELLTSICRKGWRNRLIDKNVIKDSETKENYRKRVVDELDVIKEADLAGYFLIVQDYISYFKERSLVGAGRGSVNGCLLAYLLNITDIDPILYGLSFSRFYNKARAGSLPDIDTDFEPEVREDAIQYLKNKYGDDCVTQIATYSRLSGKSIIKEVLRVNESCSFDMMNQITENFPSEAEIADLLEEAKEESIVRWTLENRPEKLRDYCYIENGEYRGDYSREFLQAIRLEWLIKSYGKHASGVIISNTPLNKICPLIRSARDSELIAGMDMIGLEALGLVKFDLLSTSFLKKVRKVCEAV